MRLFRFLLAFALCTPLPALAQYSIASIVFTDASPYTDAELLPVVGLQPGQMLSQSSLKNAAQHLVDTGMFDDAAVSSSGTGKALTVHIALKPKPVSALLPVSLKNFVWFAPDELTQGIHQALPLYHAYASDAGAMSDLIQAALEQMLAAKGVAATVSHGIIEPTNQHPLRVVDFRVESPAVRLAKIDLTGSLPAALQPDMAKAIAAATGRAYNEGLAGSTLEDLILAPARNAGYITASLKDTRRSMVNSASGAMVNVSASLDAPAAYTVSAMTLTPGPLYTAADLAHDATLHPGDIASAAQLAKTEYPLQAAYLRQGYLDVYVQAMPTLDATAHTVAYTLEAIPGAIYHLKSVTVTGLDPAAQRAFNAAWAMKEGDLYDATYVTGFLKKNIAQEVFRPYGVSYGAVGDPETHLVDLTLTFSPNPHQ